MRRIKRKRITIEELIKKLYQEPKNEFLREGQYVYNQAYKLYPKQVEQVQFIDEIDCFCCDNKIEAFIQALHKRISK